MEKFKAVEKAMKTKAYSKEGLSAAAKLDPKEQAKLATSEFLSNMVDELEQQIETIEAEGESIQATMKKGKNQSAKAERMAEIERIIERHKWHQGKLELIRRSLENGGVETEQVRDLEESIRYYVSDGMNDDFMEDDTMYDDLSLGDDEDTYGMNPENDKGSSQDTQSVQDEPSEPPSSIPSGKSKPVDSVASSGRRPSAQMKSPLPTLATVHNPLPVISNGPTAAASMKPASIPTRPAGEGLKYASAAAAAAANDKNNLGIAPLPPPPGAGFSVLPPSAVQAKASSTSSPSSASIQMVSQSAQQQQQQTDKSTTPGPIAASTPANLITAAGPASRAESVKAGPSRGKAPVLPSQAGAVADSSRGMPFSSPSQSSLSAFFFIYFILFCFIFLLGVVVVLSVVR